MKVFGINVSRLSEEDQESIHDLLEDENHTIFEKKEIGGNILIPCASYEDEHVVPNLQEEGWDVSHEHIPEYEEVLFRKKR